MNPLPARTEADVRALQRYAGELLRLWGVVPDRPVTVRYSSRLRTALGRAYLDRGAVHLHQGLLDQDESLRREVLCHEVAHLVAYQVHGTGIRPHGAEWQALVRQAGYQPSVRLRVDGLAPAARPRIYEHVCPVCQASRRARRSVPQWRCVRCVAAGLPGELTIEKLGGS